MSDLIIKECKANHLSNGKLQVHVVTEKGSLFFVTTKSREGLSAGIYESSKLEDTLISCFEQIDRAVDKYLEKLKEPK